MYVRMLNEECDRCGKVEPELRPWKFSGAITYRRKSIQFPWLCLQCFRNHKELMWRRGFV